MWISVLRRLHPKRRSIGRCGGWRRRGSPLPAFRAWYLTVEARRNDHAPGWARQFLSPPSAGLCSCPNNEPVCAPLDVVEGADGREARGAYARLCLGPISGSHQGPRPERLHSEAGYMAAPERFAETSDSFPLHRGRRPYMALPAHSLYRRACPLLPAKADIQAFGTDSAYDPGCVKTLSGMTAPGILRPVVRCRAKKCKNLSSARH